MLKMTCVDHPKAEYLQKAGPGYGRPHSLHYVHGDPDYIREQHPELAAVDDQILEMAFSFGNECPCSILHLVIVGCEEFDPPLPRYAVGYHRLSDDSVSSCWPIWGKDMQDLLIELRADPDVNEYWVRDLIDGWPNSDNSATRIVTKH